MLLLLLLFGCTRRKTNRVKHTSAQTLIRSSGPREGNVNVVVYLSSTPDCELGYFFSSFVSLFLFFDFHFVFVVLHLRFR